ncbi:MAG: FAD-dependent oxidoreductase [Nanoarchaeota archaeon]
MNSQKKIIIIGGGFTGAYCAKRLQNDFDVILIDSKEYFEFTPSILKALVSMKSLDKIQVKHSSYLKNGKFIMGKASEVGKDYVIINSKRLNFDYLIISSGSSYDRPIKEQNVFIVQRGKHILDYREKIKNSDKILIIGGGLVGVELSAEIIEKYPWKKVTIIEFNKSLISRNNEASKEYTKKHMKKNGVKVIFEEKVVKNNKNYFITDKGRKLKVDLAFFCAGIMCNSEFMKRNFKQKINNRGQIETNKFLQLDGHENIFVGGDVSSIPEEKTAQNSEEHAKIIIENIKRIEKNSELKEYKTKTRAFVISLGEKKGIYEYGKFSFYGVIPALMKKIIETKTMWRYR